MLVYENHGGSSIRKERGENVPFDDIDKCKEDDRRGEEKIVATTTTTEDPRR